MASFIRQLISLNSITKLYLGTPKVAAVHQPLNYQTQSHTIQQHIKARLSSALVMADPGHHVDCHLVVMMLRYSTTERVLKTFNHLKERFPYLNEIIGVEPNGAWILARWHHLIATQDPAYMRFNKEGWLDEVEKFRAEEGF